MPTCWCYQVFPALRYILIIVKDILQEANGAVVTMSLPQGCMNNSPFFTSFHYLNSKSLWQSLCTNCDVVLRIVQELFVLIPLCHNSFVLSIMEFVKDSTSPLCSFAWIPVSALHVGRWLYNERHLNSQLQTAFAQWRCKMSVSSTSILMMIP